MNNIKGILYFSIFILLLSISYAEECSFPNEIYLSQNFNYSLPPNSTLEVVSGNKWATSMFIKNNQLVLNTTEKITAKVNVSLNSSCSKVIPIYVLYSNKKNNTINQEIASLYEESKINYKSNLTSIDFLQKTYTIKAHFLVILLNLIVLIIIFSTKKTPVWAKFFISFVMFLLIDMFIRVLLGGIK